MFLKKQRSPSAKALVNLSTLVLSAAVLSVSAAVPLLADSNSEATAGPLGFESALTGYKSLDGTERASWKESNETVGEIGGWRTYANEAYQANKAEANEASAEQAAGELNGEDMEPATLSALPSVNATRLDPAAIADKQPVTSKQASPPSRILSYESEMSDYRLYDDNPPGDWRDANDVVGKIGGWKTYAKEAYEARKRDAQLSTNPGQSQ